MKSRLGLSSSNNYQQTTQSRWKDSDWSGNKSHRKSTSGGFHALNSCPLFNSSRTQKIISLSSCEAALHALVSSASDGIYIRAVLEFALGTKVDHYIFTNSSGARQLVTKRGVGKVMHLDGKLLWIQNRKDFKMVHVPTDSNMADLNASHLEDKGSDTG